MMLFEIRKIIVIFAFSNGKLKFYNRLYSIFLCSILFYNKIQNIGFGLSQKY